MTTNSLRALFQFPRLVNRLFRRGVLTFKGREEHFDMFACFIKERAWSSACMFWGCFPKSQWKWDLFSNSVIPGSLVLPRGPPPQGLDHSHTTTVLLSETAFFPCLDLSSFSSTFPPLLPWPSRSSLSSAKCQGSPDACGVLWRHWQSWVKDTEKDFLLSISTKQSWLLTTMASHQHSLLCFPQAFFGGLHFLVLDTWRLSAFPASWGPG